MKPYDLNLKLSMIFLALSITTQLMILFSQFGNEWLLFATTTAFATWMFMTRAIKELKKEFQNLEDIINEETDIGEVVKAIKGKR
jgi:cell shape-determining protein MreC